MKILSKWRFNRAVHKLYRTPKFWDKWRIKGKGKKKAIQMWEEEVVHLIGTLPQDMKLVVMDVIDMYSVKIMKDINYSKELDTIEKRAYLQQLAMLKQDFNRVYLKKQMEIKKADSK